MRTSVLYTLAVLAINQPALAGPPPAGPDIRFYETFKTRTLTQTDNTQPSLINAYFGYHRFTGLFLNPATLGTPGCTLPDGITFREFTSFTPSETSATVFTGSYASEAAIDADIPPGTYTFSYSAGPDSATLTQPDENLWSDVPYVSNFDTLDGAPVNADIVVDVPPQSAIPGINNATLFWIVYDPSVSFSVSAFGAIPSAEPGFVIPANTLQPSTLYVLELARSFRQYDVGGFGGALAGACFDTVTQITFVTGVGSPACNLADITDIGDTGAGPDNQLTVDDIIAFINEFSDATGCPGPAPCNRADITDIGDTGAGPDGELTVDDIIAFFNAFSDGC